MPWELCLRSFLQQLMHLFNTQKWQNMLYWMLVRRMVQQVVKGISLITLYYTENDYFLDMLKEVLSWGLKPAFVTGDSWYSCVKNLKTVKNNHLGFLFALESNRLVSVEKGSWVQVQTLDIPSDGLLVLTAIQNLRHLYALLYRR